MDTRKKMKRYLLDTTALIDFSKNREPARSSLLAMIENGDDIGVCLIAAAEFFAGISPEKRFIWDEFIGSLAYWDIDIGTAKKAGQDRYSFARKGVVLSMMDSLIAAIAYKQTAILVTNNIKDYPMKDISLLPLL